VLLSWYQGKPYFVQKLNKKELLEPIKQFLETPNLKCLNSFVENSNCYDQLSDFHLNVGKTHSFEINKEKEMNIYYHWISEKNSILIDMPSIFTEEFQPKELMF
jgi:hypothetical protein